MNQLSDETIEFFDQLLAGVQLRAYDPDFEVVAAKITKARNELLAWRKSKIEQQSNTDNN